MQKLLTLDPVVQITSGATAAVSAAASVVASDLSVAIFGVPLTTVMAAFGGAFACYTFMPPDGMLKAVRMLIVGTLIGSYLAPLIMSATSFDGFDKPIAFLLGLGAQVGIPKFFDWIKSRGGNGNAV
jgi:hypothetical protein